MTLREEIAKEISNPLPGYHPKVGLVYVSISGPALDNVVSNLSTLFRKEIEGIENPFDNQPEYWFYWHIIDEFRKAILELVGDGSLTNDEAQERSAAWAEGMKP